MTNAIFKFSGFCMNSITGLSIPLLVIRYYLRKNSINVVFEMNCFHWLPDIGSFVEELDEDHSCCLKVATYGVCILGFYPN